MEGKLRLAVGIMGNAASLLLYSAPILTFARVIRKKSTEDFSCVPYIVAFSNCFLYTWYSLPVVSYKWENFTVATVDGVGILLQLSFIFIYFYFASANGKKKVAIMAIPAFLVSCLIILLSAFAFHEHRHRKALVGSIGFVACVGMYGSPLVAVRQVIQTKSVEFMPFYLSFFSFLSSSLWLAYGLLGHDLYLASPSFVGSPLGLVQLLLYCKYRKSESIKQTQKFDIESNSWGEKPTQHVTANGEKQFSTQYQMKEKNDDERAKQQQLQLVVTDAS